MQQSSDTAGAMHRMTAWRIPSKQKALTSQQIYETGHDDDGESYGGKTIEKVLSARGVEGFLMVARWYGGVLLGPVRFDHMRKCADEAISEWEAQEERAQKRRRKERDDTDRDRLLRILLERDESIVVLRNLLAEKTEAAIGSKPAHVAKHPEYGTMPIEALKKMEEVRDRTIGWLLKRIEDAEQAAALKRETTQLAEAKDPDRHATGLDDTEEASANFH